MKPAKFETGTVLDRFDQLTNDFFNRGLNTFFGSDYFLSQPSVNVFESEGEFRIELAAPGLEKNDFNVKVEGNNLIISVQREQNEEKTVSGNYVRKEFNYSAFTRSFRLPENVNAEEIKAQYDKGILNVALPKVAPDKPALRTIAIE